MGVYEKASIHIFCRKSVRRRCKDPAGEDVDVRGGGAARGTAEGLSRGGEHHEQESRHQKGAMPSGGPLRRHAGRLRVGRGKKDRAPTARRGAEIRTVRRYAPPSAFWYNKSMKMAWILVIVLGVIIVVLLGVLFLYNPIRS